MGVFNKRFFGTNMDAGVMNKLIARQVLAEEPHVGESITLQNYKGETFDLEDAFPNVNIQDKSRQEILHELGSKTPWARIWTAVQLYDFIPAEVGPRHGESSMVTQQVMTSVGEGLEHFKHVGRVKTIHDIIAEEKTTNYEKMVYELGNHEFDLFSKQSNINEPIGDGVATFSGGHDIDASDVFSSQMSSNEFLRPSSGITSISSTTEGVAGAYKITTINFIIHNFADYQNIYSRYFLQPGALITVDFGWDTAGIYDPRDIIASDASLTKFLYGDDGWVQNQNGDMDSIIGKVTKWNSKLNEKGSYECMIEITSANSALIDHEVSEKNYLKQKFTNGLGVYVVNEASTMFGENFLNNDWLVSEKSFEATRDYAYRLANYTLSSKGNSAYIPSNALKTGVYWSNISTTADENPVETGDNNIFVNWGFFEDKIINKEIALGFGHTVDLGSFGDIDISFNSKQSWISWEEELWQRQIANGQLTKNATDMAFLYPPHWDETYNTIHEQIPEIVSADNLSVEQSIFTNPEALNNDALEHASMPFAVNIESTNKKTNNDKSKKRIPMRELFFNLKIIKHAFAETNSMNDAMEKILETVNDSSNDVFNFKIVSANRDDSGLRIVDMNYIGKAGQEIDEFDQLFIFSPHSKGSMIKSMDLVLETPNNGINSMWAIQSTSRNIPLTPHTVNEEKNQILRYLNSAVRLRNQQIGIKYLPEPSHPYTFLHDALNTTAFEQHKTKINDESGKTYYKKYSDIYNKLFKVIDYGGGSPGATSNGILPTAVEDAVIAAMGGNVFTDEEEQLLTARYNAAYTGEFDVIGNPNETQEDYEKVLSQSPPKDILRPDVVYANSIDEYYKMKITKEFHAKKLSTLLPMSLNLSIHGIGSIVNGDLFRIDHLPSIYQDATYFQTTKVTQEITPSSWTTSIEGQIRFRSAERQNSDFKQLYRTTYPGGEQNTDPKICLSVEFMKQIIPNHDISLHHFKFFELLPGNDPDFIEFKAIGNPAFERKTAVIDLWDDSWGRQTLFPGSDVTTVQENGSEAVQETYANGLHFLLQDLRNRDNNSLAQTLFEDHGYECNYSISASDKALYFFTSLIGGGGSAAGMNEITMVDDINFTVERDKQYRIIWFVDCVVIFDEDIINSVGTYGKIKELLEGYKLQYHGYLHKDDSGFRYEDGQTYSTNDSLYIPQGSPMEYDGVVNPFGSIGNALISWDHYGIDISASEGTSVHATAAGTIKTIHGVTSGPLQGMGTTVVIDHGNGWETTYGRLESVRDGLIDGIEVSRGDEIGLCGTGPPGVPEGPINAAELTDLSYLHYGITYNGNFVKPDEFMVSP